MFLRKYYKSMLFFFALIVALAACQKPGQQIAVSSNSNFHVELLFEVDGCRVYRFMDGGYSRYFSSCSGSVEWTEQHGKHSTKVEVPTTR